MYLLVSCWCWCGQHLCHLCLPMPLTLPQRQGLAQLGPCPRCDVVAQLTAIGRKVLASGRLPASNVHQRQQAHGGSWWKRCQVQCHQPTHTRGGLPAAACARPSNRGRDTSPPAKLSMAAPAIQHQHVQQAGTGLGSRKARQLCRPALTNIKKLPLLCCSACSCSAQLLQLSASAVRSPAAGHRPWPRFTAPSCCCSHKECCTPQMAVWMRPRGSAAFTSESFFCSPTETPSATCASGC